MLLEQKIKNCLERHPDWEPNRIANSTGARLGEIQAVKGDRKKLTTRVSAEFISFFEEQRI